jgi:type IV secretory pathway VirB9-like protein
LRRARGRHHRPGRNCSHSSRLRSRSQSKNISRTESGSSIERPEYTLYPYNQKPEPTVDCAPLRTTDIQLQPGETITDVALGDTERWMATPAASGDPRNAVPHLAVKPQVPGIETNLTIYTTKHIYHLLLRSRGRAMQEVEF